MRIGIDASNIRAGGGLTHLVELLAHVVPEQHGIDSVIVWAGKKTLDRLPQCSWLKLAHDPLLDSSPVHRAFWSKTKLTALAKESCDVLFVPGGTYLGDFHPFVTMSQNLLPFDLDERNRYGSSLISLRLRLLGNTQRKTFLHADGVIFLSNFAQKKVEERMGTVPGKTAVIPHGISPAFLQKPKEQLPISSYSVARPFKWTYVSIIDVYKHQWHVAEAVSLLKKKGYPITLDLIGHSHKPSLLRLQSVLNGIDPSGQFINHIDNVSYEQMKTYYHRSEGAIFASSCETFGMILLESMASGLPIACSNRSAMPEILGEAGVYFDPEKPEEIANALELLMNNVELRESCAHAAYNSAQPYSWELCAKETFSFISDCA